MPNHLKKQPVAAKKAKVRPKRRKDCSRCSRGKGETFWCFRNRYVFDVDRARELVADGRPVFELDPADVAYSVGRCEVNEKHVAHVDASIPGIVAHVYFPADDGSLVHGHRVIDGHHRAARTMQLGVPFYVYVLSEEESVEILTKAPEGARPTFPQDDGAAGSTALRECDAAVRP